MALKILNVAWLPLWCGLVLYFILLSGCRKEERKNEITILWDDVKATGIVIPFRFHKVADNDSLRKQFTIIVDDNLHQPVLGEWIFDNNELIFHPIVPFTSGIKYEVFLVQQQIGTFVIEEKEGNPPEITAIYPTSDTLPENLLKMYFEFSDPMSEGEAIRNISVLYKNTGDTIAGTFLDLQPELWNEDNTLLTLWLDPGRIKRGLIPNRLLGTPLNEGAHYKIIINSDWRGANRMPLSKSYTKEFYTVVRDSLSPDPRKWKLVIPPANSDESFRIEFGEPMDAVLATEAIQLIGPDRKVVPGRAHLLKEESIYEFTPDQTWYKGGYIIQIETRLEDLAGNNINRLFDQEISNRKVIKDEQDVIELTFIIE